MNILLNSCERVLYITANKDYLMKKQITFRYIDSAFPQLYCLRFSLKMANISRNYARK